jgi:hypothetical protein
MHQNLHQEIDSSVYRLEHLVSCCFVQPYSYCIRKPIKSTNNQPTKKYRILGNLYTIQAF